MGLFDLLAFVTFSINAFSYVMRDIKWLRIITIIAMFGDLVVYYNIRPGSPLWVQFGMSALIIVINTYQLYVLWREKQASHFEGDAGWLYRHVFAPLTPGEFKPCSSWDTGTTCRKANTCCARAARSTRSAS